MVQRKRSKNEIVGEMTDIIVAHLEALPRAEQKKRVSAFRRAINRGAKRVSNPPKVERASRIQRNSRRTRA